MTREQIIEQLDSIVGTYEILLGNGVNSDILDVDDIEAIREAISALSAEGEKKCSNCIHSAEQDGEFCYECVKGNEDNFVSAEGKYIKKEDAINLYKKHQPYMATRHWEFEQELLNLPTYSFPEREKGEWIKIQSGDKDFPESIVCSRCKEENSYLEFDEYHEPIHKTFITSKFCPNCGADMRGET